MGQLAIAEANGGYSLSHRDDTDRSDLKSYPDPEIASELGRFDDAGNYRPLKTAPTLRHGWKLALRTLAELRLALDYFYPGRLAAFLVAEQEGLQSMPLRETLERQTGMYRIAAQITDAQANELVGNFCRSDAGCLRTILWRRDISGTIASTKLAPEKFDAAYDQTGRQATVIPLLCQEACNLLVAEARNIVQAAR